MTDAPTASAVGAFCCARARSWAVDLSITCHIAGEKTVQLAMADDLTLGEIRRELLRLTAIAGSAERPKPTRINGPDHSMPGHEWDLREQPHPYGSREYVWVVRAIDEQDTADGMVHVSTPECMFPGEDFVPMYVSDARRLAMALLAAADRAEHLAHGVTRLEDRRKAG